MEILQAEFAGRIKENQGKADNQNISRLTKRQKMMKDGGITWGKNLTWFAYVRNTFKEKKIYFLQLSNK